MEQSRRSIRVMVLDDVASTREGLSALLQGSPGFTLVGAYPRADAALAAIPMAKPEVILVDLELPGADGITFLRLCHGRFPEVELLVLTLHDGARWVFQALEAGASGYVVKGISPVKLLEAIEIVHGGGSFMSSQVARLVLQSFRKPIRPRKHLDCLSRRELEVLEGLSKGLRYDQIAAELGISARTVNTHVHHIYEKLHVHNAAGAVSALLASKAAPPS